MRSVVHPLDAVSLVRFVSSVSLILLVICLPAASRAASPLMEDQDTPPAPAPEPQGVLWNQFDNVSDFDISSQDFVDGGGVFDIYDSRAADDFEIPEGDFWRIERLNVLGTYDDIPDPARSLNIVFYTNSLGRPAEVAGGCEYTQVLPDDILDPRFSTGLPDPCILGPGRYWVSVQADMFFLPAGQWFWFERTVQTLSPAVWENPGNGFGTGCVEFTPAQSCGATDPDLAFQLVGEVIDFTTPIPALDEWAMMIAAGALGLLGIITIYFKRRRANMVDL